MSQNQEESDFMKACRTLDNLLANVREAREVKRKAEDAEAHAWAIFRQHRDVLLQEHPEFRYGIAVGRVPEPMPKRGGT